MCLLNKEFVDPQSIFQKICKEHHLELLIRFIFAGNRKMRSKILICCCCKQEFQAEGHKYRGKFIHFHLSIFIANAKTNILIKFCFVTTTLLVLILVALHKTKKKCNCRCGLSHDVCGFCFSVRYLLNLMCYKICVDEIPNNFIEQASLLDHCFER